MEQSIKNPIIHLGITGNPQLRQIRESTITMHGIKGNNIMQQLVIKDQ